MLDITLKILDGEIYFYVLWTYEIGLSSNYKLDPESLEESNKNYRRCVLENFNELN